jgi:hypothetical protein
MSDQAELEAEESCASPVQASDWRPEDAEPALAWVEKNREALKNGNGLTRIMLSLEGEVRRLRALFGGFQLECCDDWSCAQNHARKAGETIAGLRAEVHRLRAELEQHKRWAGDRNYCDSCGKSILNIVTANAKLARVEALPAKWRAELTRHAQSGMEWAAEELEAALKGEP